MNYKRMTEKDWIKLGNQVKEVRKELFTLSNMSYSNLPKTITNHLTNAINQLDNYKMKAENRMFEHGGSDNPYIFFGSEKNTSKKGNETT